MKIEDYDFHKWCKPDIRYTLSEKGLVMHKSICKSLGILPYSHAEAREAFLFIIRDGIYLSKYNSFDLNSIVNLSHFAQHLPWPRTYAIGEMILDTSNLTEYMPALYKKK